jgi:hypothetical protein
MWKRTLGKNILTNKGEIMDESIYIVEIDDNAYGGSVFCAVKAKDAMEAKRKCDIKYPYPPKTKRNYEKEFMDNRDKEKNGSFIGYGVFARLDFDNDGISDFWVVGW